MNKREFKRKLKKERHPITKGKGFEFVFITIYVLLCLIFVISFNKHLLPVSIGIILVGIFILLGLPYIIIDLIRDIKIKKMYEYYKKENKILDERDDSKLLKIIISIEIVCTLILGGFIITKYIFNSYDTIKLTDIYETTLNDGSVIQLEEYKFDNDNFSLKVPVDFVAMDEDMIKKKYPNSNPPKYVLSNNETTINLAVSETDTVIKNSQINSYINAVEDQLSSVVDVVDTRFFERSGHKVGEIKFISKAIDTDIYNHMIVFSYNDYLKIISFNCTKELRAIWQKAGEDIINSLSFK